MLVGSVVLMRGGNDSRRFQRRRRSRQKNRTTNVLWLELAVIVACCYGRGSKPFGPTEVMAFKAYSPRMASNIRMEESRLIPQQSTQLDPTSLEIARELIIQETSGSRRVTKRALLESIGYGVMDPLAYQTFENSPLPPKLRPTTHVRVAEGIHSFGQDFLGVPPREDGLLYPEPAAPTVSASHSGAESVARLPYFALHPKLPGVGIRMTVLRLENGELLIHSPVAPTVELLDMLRNSFPAVGSTSKIHLFSASVSPEHWAFVRHWKEIFPSAEVWAVPGPHRRLMGVKVDHDIEHISGVPGRLGGEVELAVLEGVPMVREAVLLHRPTGTVLSAALLLTMDQRHTTLADINGAEGREELSRGPPPMLSSTTSSPRQPPPPRLPKVFGEQRNGFETVLERSSDTDARKEGRWRRLGWGLLDKTTTILNMDTLAIFAPVKTLMHAFKGNSAAFSSRVLSWDARIFVGCYGQSPLEGPKLNEMLHAALGRYAEVPQDGAEKKRLGTRLKALLPGRRGGHGSDRDGDETVNSEMQRTPRLPGSDGDYGRGYVGGRDGGSAPLPPRQGANPGVRALPPAAAQSNAESRANYFSTGAGQAAAQARAASRFPRDSQTTPTSSTETFAGTSANLAASGAARQPGDDARGAGALSPTDSATAVDGVQDASIVTPAVAADDENRGFNLADMFSRWGTSGVSPPPSTHDEGKSLRGGIQRPARTNLSGADERQDRTAAASSTALVGPSAAPEVGEEGDSSGTAGSADIFEVENRARSYLQNKVEAAGAARAVAPPTSLVPSRTGSVGTEKETGSTPTLSNEKKAASADDERSGNPLVVGPGSSYDERSAGSTAVSEEDDPFEAPFFPFADDGPFMNE